MTIDTRIRIVRAGAAALATMLGLVAASGAPGPARAGRADGGTESVFSLGAGARGIGLGRAYVGLVDDASAVYWNPAALRRASGKHVTAMYMPVFGDFTGADYTFFGAAYPTLGAGAFGIGFQRIATTFDGYDAFSRPTGESGYSESQLLIAYAFERRSKWLLGTLASGVTFKVINQHVEPFTSTAPGFDLGFRWVPDAVSSAALAVNLQDISGAEHKLDAATDVTYRTVMAGASYVKTFSNTSALSFSLQADLPERADARVHVGAEYAFAKYIAIRAGFDDGDVSFGVGVGVSRFGFDYALMSRGEAGSSHPVSFTTGFGKTVEEQRNEAAQREVAAQRMAVQRAFEARIERHREDAKRLETDGNDQGALDEWKIVLEYVPGDSQAVDASRRILQRISEQQAEATRDVENQAVIRTRFSQGLAYFEDNNYVRARSEWRAILALEPGHTGARDYLDQTQTKIDEETTLHVRRAAALEKEGRYAEAIGEWNGVQVFDPENAEAKSAIQRIRSRIEAVSQDYHAAQRRLEIVNLYNTALRDFNAGEFDKAVKGLERLISMEAGHEEARRLLAKSRRKLKPLTDEEKARIRQLYLAGMQHFAKDEYAKAITQWRQILEIDPTNESVQRNIDEARERLKQVEDRR